MAFDLRHYQVDAIDETYQQWDAGASNVLLVAPCGAGKTVMFGKILHDTEGYSCAIAHRRELVGQMSLTLARMEVRHRIIAPQGAIREIIARQMLELGRSYYDANAHCAVAGVNTLANRGADRWTQQVRRWVIDEGHHVLRDNVWGRATTLFPNAQGLAVTATPLRADGRGLGRHADGVIDVMVRGPEMRWLINQNFLTDYRIYAPKSDIDVSNVQIGSTGDYSMPALRQAAAKSHIVGDVVDSYLKIAPGKLGVTFCVSVEQAMDTAARFRQAGVPAEFVSADTPELLRAAIMRKFANREILQICNVDLFGEGFDLPALEVVSMARPTESYGLYVQQFCRVLRLLSGKQYGIIIDHVDNVMRHAALRGLPDTPQEWTLDRRERRSRSKGDEDIPAIKVCPQCTSVYERYLTSCPFCGHQPVPLSRAEPKMVDGDLFELDPNVLAVLRREIAKVDEPARVPQNLPPAAQGAIIKNHRLKQQAQHALRSAISVWAGWQKLCGRTDAEIYRKFYVDYGIDVGTAQTLNAAGADVLGLKITETLLSNGVSDVKAAAPI